MIDTIKIGIEAALRDGNANAIPTAAMINKSARESVTYPADHRK